MEAKLLSVYGSWREVADAANVTIGKDEGTREPSDKWKRKMVLAEHSPIRLMVFNIKLIGIKYWVSVHLTRHKVGIEHFCKTQRTDRTNVERNNLLQSALIDHRFTANVQTLINMSRKRLCNQASAETRLTWMLALDTIRFSHPEIYAACVPDCIYRGWCYEMKPCGFSKTPTYLAALEEYRRPTL